MLTIIFHFLGTLLITLILNERSGFTAISETSKIKELLGNLKNYLIFTKIQGIVREFGTASGVFHCNQGVFRDDSAPLVAKCDTWKHSPNLGWLWFPVSLNFLEKWLSLWVCESSWISLYLVEIRIMPKMFSPSWIEFEKIFMARNFFLIKF